MTRSKIIGDPDDLEQESQEQMADCQFLLTRSIILAKGPVMMVAVSAYCLVGRKTKPAESEPANSTYYTRVSSFF